MPHDLRETPLEAWLARVRLQSATAEGENLAQAILGHSDHTSSCSSRRMSSEIVGFCRPAMARTEKALLEFLELEVYNDGL